MINNLGFMQGRLSPIYKNLIQSFPYSNWQNEFKIAQKMQFSHIEWTVDQFLIDMNPIAYGEGMKKINEVKKKYKIKIINLTADFVMQAPFFKEDKIISNFLRLQLIKIIKNASKIGVKNFVIPLVDNSRLDNINQRKEVVFFFRGISKFLNQNKIRIAFETDMKIKDNMLFLDNLKENCFGMNYDMGNSASLGYKFAKEINTYSDKIFNVHIKDRKKNGGTVKLGYGDVNFHEVFNSLVRNNYNGNFTLQMARSKSKDHIKTLKYSQNFIKSFLNVS